MHIKKFRAANMTEALGLVKSEFGPDAVILSAVNINNNRSLFGRGRSGVEVTAARESGDNGGGLNPPKAAERHGYAQYQRNQSATGPVRSENPVIRPFRRKYDAATGSPSAATGRNRFSHPDLRELFAAFQKLLAQGVNAETAMDFMAGVHRVRRTGERLTPERIKSLMGDVLEALGTSVSAIKFRANQEKVVALIGPTGVGKTTTVAKIAAIARYRKAPKRVALISTDNYRVGGAAQLEKYAEIIGVSYHFAANRKALMQTIRQLKGVDLILIDTPGISPHNPHQLDELRGLLAKIRELEVHLLMSATTKESDLTDVIDKFSVFPVTGLVFSKIDETTTYGNIVNRLVQTRIPVSYITKGQRIPEDIETATHQRLAELLLRDNGRDEIGAKPPELLALEMDKFRSRLAEAEYEQEKTRAFDDLIDSPSDIFDDAMDERIAGIR